MRGRKAAFTSTPHFDRVGVLVAMVTRSDFTAEEWDTLQTAIEESMAAAVMADKGSMVRVVGDLREADAVDHGVSVAQRHSTFIEQVGELSDRHGEGNPRPADGFAFDASKKLKEAAAILKAKAPEELSAYRELVIDMATTAAETAQRGVFGVTAKGLSASQADVIEKLKASMNMVIDAE